MFNTGMVSRQSFKQRVIHDRLKFYLTPSNHNLQIFANAVRTGLTSKRKFLLSQYFYDEKGSKLFEKISKLPEYYLTKLEGSILASNSDEIASICNGVTLVELGSGNSRKTRTILQALLARQESLQYFPIDISYEMLKASSKALLDKYESLSITATVAEYDRGMSIAKKDIRDRKLVLFLGSSIGNFDLVEAKRFMQMIRNNLQDQDMVLIGLDMYKDSRVLNAAYNDSKGITAQFNLNILARINRELGGNFNLDKFEHHAFYNESKRRVEMHLVSKVEQEVSITGIGDTINFKEGENIHTENSYKFTAEQIDQMIENNFHIVKTWTDKKKWYSVILLAPVILTNVISRSP